MRSVVIFGGLPLALRPERARQCFGVRSARLGVPPVSLAGWGDVAESGVHPAKAVDAMQACALHLSDRIDSLRSPFGQPPAVYLPAAVFDPLRYGSKRLSRGLSGSML